MEERCLERGVGRRYSTLLKSPGRSSINPTFWVFREASLHRLDWWNSCPVATDSMTSSPSPCHEKTKIHSLAKQRAPLPSYHLRNAKSFRIPLLVKGMKTKYLFLIVNHSIAEIKTTLSSCDDQTIDGKIYLNYHYDSDIAKEKSSPGWWKSALCIHRGRSVLGECAHRFPPS